ncbi:hypothetical protein TTHT_0660 [Thermotomaculum hydrothermale]|uniref:Glycoside hydrolase family 18 n=1 Tax=Thermotomaculum hydrothermale TaxID=981385 RepID=A0A7R6SYW9_9BACT|nr:glycosyl hydrolase family 18 protein [Thermotomaculum hydrothermale]BBB32235.1 hypothetical protein TTHT_0660 [Thermotomaculum hydrothermale]
MFPKKMIVLVIIIAFFTAFANKNANNPALSFQSIHQLQSKEYQNITPTPLKSEQYYKMFTKGEVSTPRVKKQVLGYYTYWKTGTSNIQWDLLTILAYFSADIDSSGNITDLNGWPSSAPINEAHAHGVKVILTATLFGGSSIRTLIQSETNRQNCIQNLFNQVQSAGADGVCIDFELPYSSDRDYFNTFIQEISDYFHTNMPGSIVVVDTPAVNWNDRMDFNTLTDYADYLFIMAYDYHYSGGDPGPVSPLSYTSGSPWPTWAGIVQTLDDYINGTYGVGDAKKGKLILGVPYYGYDWPAKACDIPTEQRANGSAVIYSNAVDKAAQYNREWDDYSQTPFYDYNCSTSYPHQAWYDDEVSLGLKYDKVNQYNIGGTGMWALNYDGTRTELWEKLREKFGFSYITSTAHGNGSISPEGQVEVNYGKSITFNFTPDTGYHISDVQIDGNSIGVVNSYTFDNVTTDHTIDVFFEQDAPTTYIITASAGNGGSISPSGNITVNEGDDITFTITPDNGYHIKDVVVDGVSKGATSNYTFTNVTTNHTIEAQFEADTQNTFTITASAGNGGIISPSGTITVNKGDSITFSIKPEPGYEIDYVLVDGNSVGAVTSYTFENITVDHTIDAFFKEMQTNNYTITATAGEGGSIDPSGTITVNEGESITFVISANNGYLIKDVIVDGNSVGIVNIYTFDNVHENHTIEATFTIISNNKYTITAQCGEGGSIYPSGEITVSEGETKTFTISPDEGHTIDKVVVDGTDFGRISNYTFKNITSNHSIYAYFTRVSTPEIESFSASTQSGLTALTVDFSCKFNEPNNRPITKYTWIVSGDYEGSFETEEPEISLIFYAAGAYYVKVEAENDLGYKGESKSIRILPVELKSYPLAINGKTTINERQINFNSYLINPINQTARASIQQIDNEKNIETKNITIDPFRKVKLSEFFNNNSNENYQYTITPNSFLLIYTDVSGENLGAAAYQGLTTNYQLNIPHIAEETNYWNTLVSIGNKNGKQLIVTVNNQGSSLDASYSNLIDLNKFAENISEQFSWGKIYDINQSDVLNGFELFVQNNNDGAAITLSSDSYTKFYIPHIPEEKDIFWTGFTFTNTENRDGRLIFYLYNDKKKLVGTKSIEIKALSKVKGLFEHLFSEEELQQAVWGYAYSNVKTTGIEIYGVPGGAICGYSLLPKGKEVGTLPVALSDDNYWTGIVALNPNRENAFVTFKLYDGQGNIIGEKEVKIEPLKRYKSLLKDLFPENQFNEHSFVQYSSNKPLICIEVEGDRGRTYMKSLNAY